MLLPPGGLGKPGLLLLPTGLWLGWKMSWWPTTWGGPGGVRRNPVRKRKLLLWKQERSSCGAR